MSLVRDPDAAARYAADPSTAIADAHLTNVTSADVNNLIPMVSDSLSMAAPAVGGHDALSAAAGNVWTSGAATAAFDAFTPHIPDQVVSAVHDLPGGVIDTGSATGGVELPHESALFDDAAQVNDDFTDHAASGAQGLGIDQPTPWDHDATTVADPHHVIPVDGPNHLGFDLFG
jgi:hypothetical protein